MHLRSGKLMQSTILCQHHPYHILIRISEPLSRETQEGKEEKRRRKRSKKKAKDDDKEHMRN